MPISLTREMLGLKTTRKNMRFDPSSCTEHMCDFTPQSSCDWRNAKLESVIYLQFISPLWDDCMLHGLKVGLRNCLMFRFRSWFRILQLDHVLGSIFCRSPILSSTLTYKYRGIPIQSFMRVILKSPGTKSIYISELYLKPFSLCARTLATRFLAELQSYAFLLFYC